MELGSNDGTFLENFKGYHKVGFEPSESVHKLAKSKGIKSINDFYSQDELLNLIKSTGFENTEYRDLSGGIAAIHSGWKI